MKLNPYKIRLITAGAVLLLAILAVYQGIYPVKFLDIQFTPLLQRTIFNFSISALLLLIFLIVLTIFFGRFYCSTLCPFGILQEFFAFLRKKKKNKIQGNYGFKYLLSALTIGALFGGSALILRYVDPYTISGSLFSLTAFGIVFAVVIFILVFFKNRFFCTNICPIGAILGLISKFSLCKIYIDKDKCVSCSMCANSCQSGCIDHKEKNVDNETCVKCLKCLSVCKKDAVKYGTKRVEFSPKRRDLLWGIGALMVFSAGYTAGLQFTKNLAKKVKNIILPAGAQNANRMANKCLNCNLCIKACPKGILTKANKDFSAVHIDYSKGSGYCKYDCVECSKACPSGAIKKISLEEKRNTRIAMAVINEKCTKCGSCFNVCPTDAISWAAGEVAIVDGTKCIGCSKCAAHCKSGAINIFAINEQNII